MQYWAATETFGNAIRNPANHKKAVDYLDRCFNKARERNGLFRHNPEDQDAAAAFAGAAFSASP